MDRLTVWAWPWARSNDKRTVWSMWMGLCSWNFSSFPGFHWDISCEEQLFFATDDTTVVNIESESDSCASAINVTAGVDVGHSGQGNETSELNGSDRQECLLFLFPCVTCGWAMGRMFTREIVGSGRNCKGNVGLWWTCVEHGGILCVRKKETAIFHTDGIRVYITMHVKEATGVYKEWSH